MNKHTDGDPLAELAALRQRVDKLEAEHSDFQRNASRRPFVRRKFLLTVLALVLVFAGGLFGEEIKSLFINAQGNVGIGTSTANNRLTVNGSASFGGTASNTGGEPVEVQGTGAGYSLYDRAGGAKERWVMYSNRTGEAGTNTLRFWSNGDKAAITPGGNVGIGTNDPKYALQISDFAPGDRYIALTTDGGNKYKTGIKLWAWQKDYGFTIEHDETKPGLNILRNYADGIKPDPVGKTALFIGTTSGNVGIGTTSPGATLDVVGPVMDKLDVIVNPDDAKDWAPGNTPVLNYFRGKLNGKEVGTHIKAITNNPRWPNYIWEAWVASDGKIKVMHVGGSMRIVDLQ
jgi:hypothetical protein